jgi:hypothetical protein
LTGLTDVVVPLPLPLSAILILVIGKFVVPINFDVQIILADLGFELFVAVGLTFNTALLHLSPTLYSFHLRGTNRRRLMASCA